MSGEDLIALTAVFASMAVILSLAMVHGMHQAQEASEAWRKLAYRHRLDFNTGARVVSKTSVTGSLGGREFLLQRAGGVVPSVVDGIGLDGEVEHLPIGRLVEVVGQQFGLERGDVAQLVFGFIRF